MDKEIKKEFKKFLSIFFYLKPENIHFGWGEDVNEKGIPSNKIFIGRRGAPRPDHTLSPYDIEKLVYTKPGFFKDGELTVIGTEGNELFTFNFKDKSNMKLADKFNECLALYKKYNLGK